MLDRMSQNNTVISGQVQAGILANILANPSKPRKTRVIPAPSGAACTGAKHVYLIESKGHVPSGGRPISRDTHRALQFSIEHQRDSPLRRMRLDAHATRPG